MSRLRIPVAISALLLTVSCGRLADSFRPLNAPATTEVKILPPRIAGLSAQATLLGGIMVYAVNNQEHFRRGGRKMPDEMAPLTWMIPTAEYVFYAVGWQAPNLSSGSQMMCGKTSGPVRLNGEPTTIQLIMSAAFCGEHPFSAAGWNSGTQPQPFYVAMCASGDDPPISSSCSGSTRYFKVSFPSYDAWNGEVKVPELPGHEIESTCLSATATPVLQSILVPSGATPPGNGMVMGISTFPSAGCLGTKRLYGFGAGLFGWSILDRNIYELDGSPMGGGVIRTKVGSNGTNVYVYLKDF